MLDAKKAGDDTQVIAETIANRHGARVTPLNLKTAESIARKLKDEPNAPIKDGARTTIIVSKDKIAEVVNDLKRHNATDRYKE